MQKSIIPHQTRRREIIGSFRSVNQEHFPATKEDDQQSPTDGLGKMARDSESTRAARNKHVYATTTRGAGTWPWAAVRHNGIALTRQVPTSRTNPQGHPKQTKPFRRTPHPKPVWGARLFGPIPTIHAHRRTGRPADGFPMTMSTYPNCLHSGQSHSQVNSASSKQNPPHPAGLRNEYPPNPPCSATTPPGTRT